MSVSRSLALWRLARATPRVVFLARPQGNAGGKGRRDHNERHA